ncbi:MAG: DedA family protein [Methanobacterium sp.]|uniref:DedA family protein n=1 Tax=Methanobacterium sp. TaxID=2164 RepID=UPI003D65F1B9|nr:DedA family protein [Methanobacterium sp.]
MISILDYVSQIAINLIEYLGYWGVFIGMLIESACIPLPSEVIMPFAGFAVSEGKMTLWGITIAGVLGNLVGSWIAYFVGLKGGKPFLEKYGKYVLISQRKLDIAHNWFEKYGHEAVLISRMLPIVRTFISLPAGIAEMNFKKFTVYTVIGCLPWCFMLGYIGVMLGPHWDVIRNYFHILDVFVGIGIVAVIIYIIYHYRNSD